MNLNKIITSFLTGQNLSATKCLIFTDSKRIEKETGYLVPLFEVLSQHSKTTLVLASYDHSCVDRTKTLFANHEAVIKIEDVEHYIKSTVDKNPQQKYIVLNCLEGFDHDFYLERWVSQYASTKRILLYAIVGAEFKGNYLALMDQSGGGSKIPYLAGNLSPAQNKLFYRTQDLLSGFSARANNRIDGSKLQHLLSSRKWVLIEEMAPRRYHLCFFMTLGLHQENQLPEISSTSDELNREFMLDQRLLSDDSVTFAKFGDGEYNACNFRAGANCDRTPYTRKLGSLLNDAFKFLATQEHVYLAKWHSNDDVVSYFNSLICSHVPWVGYHWIMIHDKRDFTTQKLIRFAAIKKSRRRKLLVSNSSIALNACKLLSIDQSVTVEASNWFELEFDAVINKIIRLSGKGNGSDLMFIIAAGMGAKVLIYLLRLRFPSSTIVDVGSGLDIICSGIDRRGNLRYYTHEELARFVEPIYALDAR